MTDTDADRLAGTDPVMDALDELLRVARENIVSWVGVMDRAEMVRELRRSGMAYSAMQVQSTTPSIIDAISRNQERLGHAAATMRRSVAHALVDEGMSHADIARLFGVSRQRVGMLLRPDDSGEAATAVAGANADRSDFPTTSDSPV